MDFHPVSMHILTHDLENEAFTRQRYTLRFRVQHCLTVDLKPGEDTVKLRARAYSLVCRKVAVMHTG